jgi:hypothetical protein
MARKQCSEIREAAAFHGGAGIACWGLWNGDIGGGSHHHGVPGSEGGFARWKQGRWGDRWERWNCQLGHIRWGENDDGGLSGTRECCEEKTGKMQ